MATLNKRKFLIIAAFAAVYTIWGSTYIAIRFAIQSLPPFLMAGTRFIIAGALMYAWLMLRGAERPTATHWRSAILVGCLLLVGGNGGVVWAEQTVPSGLVSLLVSVVPIWIALIDWLRPRGPRPSMAIICGLLLGLAGVALLIGSPGASAASTLNALGITCVILGSLSWSLGSVLSLQLPLPKNPLVACAMQMLCGGTGMLLLGLFTGELSQFHPTALSQASLLSFAYLIVFGSMVGYSAYVWLLQEVSAASVATYAYVNPVVAVFLGWLLAGETVGPRTFLASTIIIGAVALITTMKGRVPRTVLAAPEKNSKTPGIAVAAVAVENRAARERN